MAKQWMEDTDLVSAISGNLFAALPLLPKRLVRVDAITHEFDMPFSHVQIMCLLFQGEATIGTISASLGIAKPNITPLLDALKNRGLLERRRSEKDRRVVYVALTAEGEQMAQKLKQSIGDQVMRWPSNLSHSEAKRLNNALACLISFSMRMNDEEQ